MNTADPKEMIRALVKLRGSTDGRPCIWWYAGTQYAVVDMESQPLWQVEGAQLSKFEPLGNGGWRHTMRDIMFYLDANTGEPLENFRNPWTGETVKVPISRFGPFSVNYTVEGHIVDLPPAMRDSLSAIWTYEPVLIQGDDLYVRESGVTKILRPGAKTRNPSDFHHINDYLTMYGRLSDIDDPRITNAPARNTYGSANDWTPWLKMDGRPGFVIGRGNSTKIAAREQLPSRLLALIERHEPGFFRDPKFPIWNDATLHPLNNPE